MDQVNSMMTKLMSVCLMMTTMLQITLKLEQIYTTVDWPFKNASMNASLFQLGKTDFASHLITGNVSNFTTSLNFQANLELISGSWPPL